MSYFVGHNHFKWCGHDDDAGFGINVKRVSPPLKSHLVFFFSQNSLVLLGIISTPVGNAQQHRLGERFLSSAYCSC